jgi:uncharacterized protein
MQTVAAAQIEPVPWRNGGGRTRELLAWPEGGGWQVRVSLADIEHDGPFSSFPGVQRWFAVVQGAGVRLRFADAERSVRSGDAPLHFDGAHPPGCSLIDGPTRDLNLMLRGGHGAMVPVTAGAAWDAVFEQRCLFARVAGRLTLRCNEHGDEHPLPAQTLAWGLGDSPCRFVPDDDDGGAPCGWWMGFTAAASTGGSGAAR